jgi:hypothetical protein
VPSFARSLAAACACLAVIVAACGSTASPSPSRAASSSPSPTSPSPSLGPSSSSAPSVSGAVGSPAPSIDVHGAPELEARLPTRLGGTELTTVSLSGDTFIATGGDAGQGQLLDLLDGLGRRPADLSVAEAHDPSGLLVLQVGLFRVAGADPDALAAAWLAAQQAAEGNRLRVGEATIDGRTVTTLEDPAREIGGDTYIVPMGDTLVLVRADDQALVAEALAAIG